MGTHWSPVEIALVMAGVLADGDIAGRTGRSVRAVSAQRRRLERKRAIRLGLYPHGHRTPGSAEPLFSVLQRLPVP
ncbi:Uncharacterised protein [Mycobacteroides abscessus subsp. abscessus]|nr:Uncharacterised protein [Mycobacteroides abscessus subsp. abscessus]